MLVLTRKLRESIMIGDEVEITVLAVMGEKVRLGITAPKSVPVFRKEIYVDGRSVRTEDAGPGAPAASGDVAGEDPLPLVTPEGVIGEPPVERAGAEDPAAEEV